MSGMAPRRAVLAGTFVLALVVAGGSALGQGPAPAPSPAPKPSPELAPQAAPTPAPDPAIASREGRLAPALVTGEPGAPAAERRPLGLARVRIEATIVGRLARTRATLTFRNDTSRTLEGELVFPLPEGATVSGYALDVQGELVDAVPVGREQARIAFEQEVRRGIDPGLVEWVRGNAFRTRVWPVPPHGTRTARVDFVSDLATPGRGDAAAALYRLPFGLLDPVPELEVRIEVVRGEAKPEIRGQALANLAFEAWRDGFVAERTLRDERLTGDLVVALPRVGLRDVAVEESAGQWHFLASDEPEVVAPASPAHPRRVAVLWDASLSRARSDREPDLRFVEAWLRRLDTVTVDVVAFRNRPEATRTFEVRGGDATAVLAHLRSLPLDGGTSFRGLSLRPEVSYALLLGDGLPTLEPALPVFDRPVFAVATAPRADRALLRGLAERSGGALVDLAVTTNEEALAAVGASPFSLLGVEVEPAGAVADLVPGHRAPVQGRVTVAGRLLAPEARLTLRYGRDGGPVTTRSLVVRRADSSASGLVALAWAQRRVAELSVSPEENREELTRLGRAHGIVTPDTSLLVLETLDQHLRHGIPPAPSRKALLEAFNARRAEIAASGEKQKLLKLERVVELWRERVAWWEREFPRVAKQQDKPRGRNGGRGEGFTTSSGAPAEELMREAEADAMPAPEAVPPPPAAPSLTADAAPRKADGDEKLKREGGKGGASAEATISIKPWDPQTPYLDALRAAGPGKAYAAYLAERERHGRAPAFYLDCAGELARQGSRDLAVRVLTSIAELELDDARLLRVAAHRLLQVGEHDLAVVLFERVARLRPEEPQSPRDLAIALVARADATPGKGRPDRRALAADYGRAVALLYDVVLGAWDGRFPEVETITLEELNRVLAVAERSNLVLPERERVDSRLVKLLDLDLRVVLTWDTDLTDMDLWVIEPTGERGFYGNALTGIGGRLSRDFTGGFGPEEYLIHRAVPGSYQIKANFFGSRSQSLLGATTLQATVFTNFGRADERREAITLRLTDARETVDVGSVRVGGTGGAEVTR